MLLTILIVDEDEIFRSALCKKLREAVPCRIEPSLSAQEDIVSYCRETLPDLVFLEVRLFEISGLDLAQQIRPISPATQIYILSAYWDVELVKAAWDIGINGFYRKPVSFRVLQELARKIVHSDQKVSDAVIQKAMKILDAGDYMAVYQGAGELSDAVYEQSGGDAKEAAGILRGMRERILKYCLKNDSRQKVTEQLPVMNEAFLNDRHMIEMWITSFLDVMYRERFAEHYEIVRSVFDYIEPNIKEYISMTDLIEHSNISQQYLLRLFKKQMNMSAMNYIQCRKIMLAKSYLYFGNDSVLDVAMKLGFGDGSYFTKIFKKYEHITPYQYKKDMEEKGREEA